MRVLVTGAAGYLGSAIATQLCNTDGIETVVGIDNFYRGNLAALVESTRLPKFRLVEADLLDSYSLRQQLAGVDVAINAAAVTPNPFANPSPQEFEQINHWGVAALAREVQMAGTPRLIHISSGAVYGFTPADNARSGPTEPYGWSKLRGEEHLRRLGEQETSVITLRMGTVYGLNLATRFDTFINRFLKELILGRPVVTFGSGNEVRPVISLENAAQLAVRAATGNLTTGTFDCFEAHVTVNEVLAELAALPNHVQHVSSRYEGPLPSQIMQGTPYPGRDQLSPWEINFTEIVQKIGATEQ